jgi:hypothetical protein
MAGTPASSFNIVRREGIGLFPALFFLLGSPL